MIKTYINWSRVADEQAAKIKENRKRVIRETIFWVVITAMMAAFVIMANDFVKSAKAGELIYNKEQFN